MKRELIVPVRDRRSRRRILTLKNFGTALLVLLVVLIAANFAAEIRDRHAADYGRLVRRELPPETAPARPAPQVVTEAPVADQTSADPMLVAPAAREQYLGVNSTNAAAIPAAPPSISPQPIAPLSKGESVAIVGDGTGVSVVGSDRKPAHVLRGGIFKQ